MSRHAKVVARHLRRRRHNLAAQESRSLYTRKRVSIQLAADSAREGALTKYGGRTRGGSRGCIWNARRALLRRMDALMEWNRLDERLRTGKGGCCLICVYFAYILPAKDARSRHERVNWTRAQRRGRYVIHA